MTTADKDEIINKMIDKKILVAKIKLLSNECHRIDCQINQLTKERNQIMIDLKRNIDEIDSIGEFISNIEYNNFIKKID